MVNYMSNITGDCYDDFGNVVPCSSQQETFVSETTTTQAPSNNITLKSQEEVDYANEVAEDFYNQAASSRIPETFTADFEGRPPGGTADAPGTIKMVDAGRPWWSWLNLATIYTNLFVDEPEYEKVDIPILEQNYTYLRGIEKVDALADYEMANTLFQTLNKYPVIDGKPVTSDNLQTLMQDPSTKKKIMKFATDYANSPAAKNDWDLQWKINMNHLDKQIITNRYADARTVMSSNMKWVAENLDSKAKLKYAKIDPKEYERLGPELRKIYEEKERERLDSYTNYAKSLRALKEHPYTDIFDKDNQILSKADYIIKYINPQIEKYNEEIKKKTQNGTVNPNIEYLKLPNGRTVKIDHTNDRRIINEYRSSGNSLDVKGNPIRFNYNAYKEAQFKDATQPTGPVPIGYKDVPSFNFVNGKPVKTVRKVPIYSDEDQAKIDAQWEAMEQGYELNPWKSNVEQYVDRVGTGAVANYKPLPLANAKNYKTVVKELYSQINKLGDNKWAQTISLETIDAIYSDRLRTIKNMYNDQKTSGIQNLVTLNTYGQNPFTMGVGENIGNRGQKLQAVPQKMSFDFNGKNYLDDEGYMRDETVEFSNLVEMINEDYAGKVEKAPIVVIGKISGEIPKESQEGLQTFFKEFAQKMHDEGDNAQSKNPYGDITFQAVAGGDPNMYAYNIKIKNSDYYTKFKGTEDVKGPLHSIIKDETTWNKLKDEGVTIYVPRSVAEKIRTTRDGEQEPVSIFGYYAKKARETTIYESEMQRTNKLNITIPNAGSTIITRDVKNNTITISGYTERLDPDSGRYVKTPLQTTVIPSANLFNIDDLYARTTEQMKEVYDDNKKINEILLRYQKIKSIK